MTNVVYKNINMLYFCINFLQMLKKGTKLYSILTGSCPKCHLESIYQSKNLYDPSMTLKMNETCSHCGTKYKIEPSFFYGAMYISYPVGILFAVGTFLISYVLLKASVGITFISIVVTMVLLLPVILRISRNIWINFFFKYDPKITKK